MVLLLLPSGQRERVHGAGGAQPLTLHPPPPAAHTQWSAIAAPVSLELANCSLSGPIPWTGADALPAAPAAVLELSRNALTGAIPPELGGTPELRLSGNNLTGAIPPELAAPALRRLLAARNALQGPPPSFVAAGQLEELDLAGNQLAGALPDLPPNVTRLALDGNPQLGGTLPAQARCDGRGPPGAGACAARRRLRWGAWQTAGQPTMCSRPRPPPQWGSFARLATLRLDGSFSGPLPPEWGAWTQLREFKLHSDGSMLTCEC